MGWLKKLVGFENSFSVDIAKDIISDPTRLITGVDPLSTKVWNGVTGSDNKALVNVWGSPGEQYYESAAAKGIDVGPARQFHAVADTIAGIYAAQGMGNVAGNFRADMMGSGGESVGMNFDFFGGEGSIKPPIESSFSMDNIKKFGDAYKSLSDTFSSPSYGNSPDVDLGGQGFLMNATSAAPPSMSSTYQSQYGSVADKYAKQYGVPTDLFRSTIDSISGFNPYKVNPDGTGGIAGLTDGAMKGANIYDPDSSLKTAAQTMAAIFKDNANGSWNDAAAQFKVGRVFNADGTPVVSTDSRDVPAYDAMGNPTGMTQGQQEDNTIAAADPETGKPFWQYSAEDWKELFQNSIFSLLFGVIGVVFILGSIYMLLTNKSNPVIKYIKTR